MTICLLVMPLKVIAERCVSDDSDCIFGVFPHTGVKQISDSYGAISEDIGLELGVETRLTSSGSLELFREDLIKGRFDIALIGPGLFVTASRQQKYIPLARLINGLKFSVIVRDDSDIFQPLQLRNKTVGIVVKNSATAIVTRSLIQNAGINIHKDQKFKVFRTIHACAFALASEIIDACGVAEPVLATVQEQVKVKFRKIMESETFASSVYVAHPDVSAEKQKLLQNYLLNRGRMVIAVDDDFQSYRDLLKDIQP